MKDQKKSNTMLIVLVSILVALVAYWFFFVNTGNEPPLTSSTQQNEAQARFQQLVSALGPITFDTSIFNDARFKALVDLSTPIAPEPAGRVDPFAPF